MNASRAKNGRKTHPGQFLRQTSQKQTQRNNNNNNNNTRVVERGAIASEALKELVVVDIGMLKEETGGFLMAAHHYQALRTNAIKVKIDKQDNDKPAECVRPKRRL